MNGLIRRQAVIDLFKKYQPRMATSVIEFGNALKELPTVEAEPVRHGHWIEYPLSLVFEKAYSKDHIVCSCCEEAFNVFDNDTERFDYCPHCGAKMDEVSE